MNASIKHTIFCFLFVVLFLLSSATHSQNNNTITIRNYEELAREAVLDLMQHDDSKKMRDIYAFVNLNNIVIKDQEFIGLLLLFEGYIELEMNSYITANELFFEAYDVFDTTKKDLYKAFAANLIAITYSGTTPVDDELAIDYFKKAIDYFKTVDMPNIKMITNFNITNLLIKYERYEEALEFGLESYKLVLRHNINNMSVKYLCFNIALCYISKKEFDAAKKFLNLGEAELGSEHKIARTIFYKTYAKFYSNKNLKETAYLYKDSLMNSYHQAYALQLAKYNKKDYEYKKLSEAIKIINKDILSKKQQFLYLLWAFVGMFFLLSLYLASLIKELRKSKLSMKALLRENERSLMSKLYNITTKNEFLNLTVYKLENLIRSEEEIKKSSVLSIIKDIERNTNKNEVWEEFQIHFENTNPDFFKRLRSVNVSITAKDLKLSAYILANMDTKEIASLIGISVRSVETSKYRLKKKLNVDKDENLFNFLNSV